MGEADEKADFYNSGNAVEGLFEAGRILDAALEGYIKYQVAVICNITISVARAFDDGAESFNRAANGGFREGDHFDRKREGGSELANDFIFPYYNNFEARERRDDLLAQQRAAATLNHSKGRIDFVGAVDGQIEGGNLIEANSRNPVTGGRRFRRLRRANALDL